MIDTRLGGLAWRSSGNGPALVFFAGALANGALWRDVIARLESRYRCISVDLPLGAHSHPLSIGADRSAPSLARLLLDCLDLLGLDDATVVANDTAGGLLLLSLASGHPGLGTITRLVLTNCDSYDQFPPDALKKVAALCRRQPRLARGLMGVQLRLPMARDRLVASVTAAGLDDELTATFFGPGRRVPGVLDDLVGAMAGCRPELLVDAAAAISGFNRPVMLIWGDSDRFFPMAHAERLASDFPTASLISVRGARTWVPIDNPSAVADAILNFVPTR